MDGVETLTWVCLIIVRNILDVKMERNIPLCGGMDETISHTSSIGLPQQEYSKQAGQQDQQCQQGMSPAGRVAAVPAKEIDGQSKCQ